MDRTYSATGSRKTATAKVWLTPGTGEMLVNNRSLEKYFGREDLIRTATAPLRTTGLSGAFDLKCTVCGGGLSAQAAAVSLGTARALVIHNAELRKTLKGADLLKRDPRERERMKYGLAKRRKRFQWTKR